jgi:hypothetical protein
MSSIESILSNLEPPKEEFKEQNSGIVKLLATVLSLNNLKNANDKKNREKISSTLDKCYEIILWIISSKTLNQQNKKLLLNMTLELQVYLLSISESVQHLEIIKKEKFLTDLSITIFFMSCKTQSQQLSKIFDLILNNTDLKPRDIISGLEKDALYSYRKQLENMLLILEHSFKFWQNIVKVLLNNPKIQNDFFDKPMWMDNLIFSLDFYLSSFDKLYKCIDHIQENNEWLKVDEEIINISKLSPRFEVIKSLIGLLQRFNTNSQDITTLWSLVFESLAWIDAEKIKKEWILENLVGILLESSIELQEITYLVQTNFRIHPKPQFVCNLMFEILNKSIGTKHEETVYTLCDNWMNILIEKPNQEIESLENIKVLVTFNNVMDIASIFESTTTYLIKYLNWSYFGGVVGASQLNFKKASIISKLFTINKALNDEGELVLEKAFMESKNDAELASKLQKGFENIITWLFLNSGEHTGPISWYIKSLESNWKYMIMVKIYLKL